MAHEAQVHVSVVDLHGRMVAVLADGVKPAGRHRVIWHGMGERGPLPAGVYFVSYQVAGQILSKRTVLAR